MNLLKTARLAAAAIAVCATTIPGPSDAAATQPSPIIPPTLAQGERATAWADSVMAGMTLRQKVGQLFIPRLDVYDNPAGHAALRNIVTKGGIGGFLLGKGTVAGYASLIKDAQSVAKVPLLVTLDGEWGLAMRLSDAPRFPHSMALGAAADPSLLEDYGREVARECRHIGIHVNFAPVLDVNSNPRNPVIGYRSFGENPQRVAELGTAYARGLEAGGVMSVAKHFPGHGDTSADSHKVLPTVDHSSATMDTIDLVPFKAFVNQGLSGVMTGHLRVPSLDAKGTPASLSATVTSGLLRGKMNFGGLIFTDALAMKGAVSPTGENNCISALKAGADVLLCSAAPMSDIAAVTAAVQSGDLPLSTIEDACRRILAAKYNLILSDTARVPRRPSAVSSPLASAVKNRLAAASVTLLRDSASAVPVRGLDKNSVAVISIGAPAANAFSDRCAAYTAVDKIRLDAAPTAAQAARIAKADVKIVAFFSSSASAVAAFSAVARDSGVIAVFMMNPYKLTAFRQSLGRVKTLLVVGDDTPEIRDAAAQAVFGGADITGRFPVNLPGIAMEGDGISVTRSRLGYTSAPAAGLAPRLGTLVDSIARASIAAGAMPGCQIVVARKGNVVIDRCYGRIERGGTAPVTSTTLYDIASMTKATATAAGIMAAYDSKLFRLTDAASKYIPGLQTPDKQDITIEQLLYHESGMPATLNMWKILTDPDSYTAPLTRSRMRAPYTRRIAPGVYAHASARLRTDILSRNPSSGKTAAAKGLFLSPVCRDTVMSRIYAANLRASKSYHYSCLNFCLLMELEENVTGEPHAQWVNSRIFAPLGASHTLFRPLEVYPEESIAPTEKDEYLRSQTIRGYVHDEIAAFSGGIQGNAGLFSTAGDIAKYSQMLLQEGTYGNERLLEAETVRKFTRSRSRGGRRALAFDLAAGVRSLDSTGVNDDTYGHTGFTGTCFWIDPREEIIVVFLTNRINPSRNTPAFSRTNPRGALLKAVYSCLPSKDSPEE